jgi:hypothetical protein
MGSNPFSGTKEAATPADTAALEQAYDFTLPTYYKAHLLRYNGGGRYAKHSYNP